MSELLKKYESIDQSKLNEGAIKILNRVKTITSDFTTDDAKNNKIAEDVLNEIMKKYPDSVKIVKRTSKTKPAPKKVAKAKKPATTSTAKKSGNNIMSVAKEIQKAGESWKDAMERAKQVLKERREQVIQKQKTELEKLYALVKTKKELQGFAKSDIQRDAVRDAKPRGARVVTKEGSTSNQYGTFRNKLGRKYWETRDRHADRLAPNYPKDMPLLANGGGIRSKEELEKIFSEKEAIVKNLTPKEIAELWNKNSFGVKEGVSKPMTIEQAKIPDMRIYLRNLLIENELTEDEQAKYFADGGSVSNERMYNFLKDDLAQLEEAIKSGDMEEVNRFFSYWLGSSNHLKSLETKTNERMYNFLKDDLKKLEIAVENNDTEEVERFFSYWGQHLESLKMANGGSLQYLTDPNFGNFQNTGAFEKGGSVKKVPAYAKRRLEELREEIREERISTGEIAELQSLAQYIEPSDVELLQWAGVFEFEEEEEEYTDFSQYDTIAYNLTEEDAVKLANEQSEKDPNSQIVLAFTGKGFNVYVKKASFELGGAFMTTDLAGHSGGGTGGLNANLPLNGFSGTNYTGLVGETGAMSSGELFMDGGAVAQNQQVIDGASQSYVNYYLANDGISQASYKDGGAIENQYEGKTPEEIWNSLSKQQRGHFLYDHVREIEEYKNIERLPSSEIIKAYNSEWSSLDKDIKNRFANHTREGQYASGGVMEKNQQVIDDASQSYINYYLGEGASQGIYKDGGSLGEELMGGQSNSTLKPSGYHLVSAKGREIIVSDDGGNSKERWVKNNGFSGYRLVYKGNDYEFTDSFEGGGFTPEVSDGTQFMSEAYAYGGRTKSRPSMRELYIENIAFATNTRTAGVDAFAKEHNLTDSELSNLMTGIGRKMISQSDFITALVGNKNNPKQKEVVAFAKSDKAYKMADGGDVLPPSKTYGENIYKAMQKFNISDSESRKRYGQFTINQWNELLEEKMADGGGIRSKEELKKIFSEKEAIVKNLTPKQIAKMWNENSFGVKEGISKPITIEEAKKPSMKIYLENLLIENELTEDEQAKYFAKGGEIEIKTIKVGDYLQKKDNKAKAKVINIKGDSKYSTEVFIEDLYGNKVSRPLDFTRIDEWKIINEPTREINRIKKVLSEQYANGGSFSDYLNSPQYKELIEKQKRLYAQLKSRVVRAVGIDEAIEFFDYEHSSIAPYRFLERAVQGNLITLDEINEELVKSALQETYELDSDEDLEEIGGSDFTYYLKNVLDGAGFKVGFVNSRLQRLNEDGSVKEIENNYADGGSFLEDNEGFMRADNEFNYRYPTKEVYIETLDEDIDLRSYDSDSNDVDVRMISEDIDLNDDNRIRARMTQSNRGSAENFGKINPRAFEFIDLPMPTSNKHKND